MKKRILALLLAIVTALSLTACFEEDFWEESFDDVSSTTPTGETADWAIYWYLCGSDLESESGCATIDMMEMMEVTLPEGVNVVIQTGGSYTWQNDLVDASVLQRYVYNSEGLSLVDEQPSANMGDKQTLEDFLSFAKQNYPANKTAVLFWNHGGGSVSGAAFDELYDYDSLNLAEMYDAFTNVWQANDQGNPPLELVGFDTCLMATVDVAFTFSDLAHYLVGSEETEPGNGWYYTGWLDALAKDPSMDGATLGKAICDSYYQGCELEGTQDYTTLSLTDLTKVMPLIDAYDAFGAEALAQACADPTFFSQFARAANNSENYGGNTREEGYANMVDLGHLARQTSDLLTSSNTVLKALEDCVLYQVKGAYRSEATGLSCYYSYNGDEEDLAGYTNFGTGEAFKHFFTYGITGTLNEDGLAYIADLEVETLPEVQNLSTMHWDDAPLDLTDDGTAYLELGPEANDILVGIHFSLFYIDEQSDTIMMLGTDNDIESDWENGIFYDNFRGVWGSIDGELVYMELSYEGDDYNLYAVPVLLNCVEYSLQVVYDFTTESWSILGATQGIDDNGMADKQLRLLQEGDILTVIWYMASFSGDDDLEAYTVTDITVTADTSFAEVDLYEGSYRMIFEMWDAAGNYAYSDYVDFDCIDGDIYTTVYE